MPSLKIKPIAFECAQNIGQVVSKSDKLPLHSDRENITCGHFAYA